MAFLPLCPDLLAPGLRDEMVSPSQSTGKISTELSDARPTEDCCRDAPPYRVRVSACDSSGCVPLLPIRPRVGADHAAAGADHVQGLDAALA